MSNHGLDKHFVSPIDKKIRGFDKNHAPSEVQQAEIEKYKRISELRDKSSQVKKTRDIWDL